MGANASDLEHRFAFHPATTAEKQADHGSARRILEDAAHQLDDLVPEGREKSVVFTKLEEAMFWANAGIARRRGDDGSAGTVALIVLAVLLVIVLPIAFFAAKTALAPTIGKAKAYQAKNSALNRVQAQERFEEMYQDVLASDRRLDPLAAAKGESLTAKQTYLGAVSYCISTVGEYNAEARKYSAAEFRAIDLPPQIDPYTPETDCKESS